MNQQSSTWLFCGI